MVYHTYHTYIFKFHVDSLRFKTELDATWALCFFAVDEWKIHKWVSQKPSISGAQKWPTSGSRYGFTSLLLFPVCEWDSYNVKSKLNNSKRQSIVFLKIYMFHTKQNRFNLKSYLYLVLLHYNCNRWSSGTSRWTGWFYLSVLLNKQGKHKIWRGFNIFIALANLVCSIF